MGDWPKGLEVGKGELVISKQYPSAFFGTSLASTLASWGVDTLIHTGVTTSGCVRATCIDSCSHGFIPIIPREAVGDRHEAPHEANLSIWTRNTATSFRKATSSTISTRWSKNDPTQPESRAGARRIRCGPGIHDMITAVVSNKVGFDFVYSSGFWGTASQQGIPDAGIATYTDMVGRVETLCRTVKAGVIADADTGYGGLLNVDHTVRGYEAAGAVGIQLEDQEFPKKCGHTPYKRVVPTQDMVNKIKVACEARQSPKTLIIARTDARAVEGFQGAIDRVWPTAMPAPTSSLSRRLRVRTKCAARTS